MEMYVCMVKSDAEILEIPLVEKIHGKFFFDGRFGSIKFGKKKSKEIPKKFGRFSWKRGLKALVFSKILWDFLEKIF